MKYLLITMLMSMSSPVYSLDYKLSGEGLLQYCKDWFQFDSGDRSMPILPALNAGKCYGYILSASGTYDTYVNQGFMQPLFCMPKEVDPSQLVYVVVGYLEAHREDLHLDASDLVVNAFNNAFPCE